MDDKRVSDALERIAELSVKLVAMAELNTQVFQSSLVEHKNEIRNIVHRERAQFYIAQASKQYDFASKYSTVIIFGGYAAFFTIWANIQSSGIPKDLLVLSASLVGLSVLIFCVFEILKMVVLAKSNSDYATAVASIEKHLEACEYVEMYNAMARACQAEESRNLSLVKYWKPILYSTLALGVLGVAVLLRGISLSLNFCDVVKLIF